MNTIAWRTIGASDFSRSVDFPFHSRDVAGTDPGEDVLAKIHAWANVIDELLRIRNLEDDWDGEGTIAPNPALVDGAITLAQNLRDQGDLPPQRVHASVNATVYFEWHMPEGYREIEVLSPVQAECRFVRKGTNTTDVVSMSRQS